MHKLLFWARIIGFVLLLCPFTLLKAQQSSVRVKVIDAETQSVLSNAYIHIGKKGYAANTKGYIVLPMSSVAASDSLSVQNLGYESRRLPVNIFKGRDDITIPLQPSVTNLQGVVVSQRSSSKVSVNAVSVSLDATKIEKALGSNLASMLETVSGVSMVQTGATVAKPVVNGMFGTRLLILNNGVRQVGQQWGADHAPEIDANAAGSIEVIKGADAIRYGAEALGGVILLNQKALPYGSEKISGKLQSMYGSNGQRFAGTAYLEGAALDDKSLAWNLQGSYLNGGDRSTALYLLNNTGQRESNIVASVGLQKRSYGIDLFYSRYANISGVLYTAQMGDRDLLKQRIELGQPVETGPFSREIDVPKQKVRHHLWRLRAFYKSDSWGRYELQSSYQLDKREEFHMRRNNLSHVPSLSLTLWSVQNFLKWDLQRGAWQTQAGFSQSFSRNSNRAGTGVVPIIPNYTEQTYGLYALEKWERGPWSAELGLRADLQKSISAGIDSYSQEYGGSKTFRNFTYTLGGKYRISPSLSITSNLGLAWRAPHVHELYSHGLEHATAMYLMGDETLRSEHSHKWVTALHINNEHLSVELSGYLQWIQDFIYDEPTGDYRSTISGFYPIFAYKQTDAFLRGIDLEANWYISQAWRYAFVGSVLWANEMHSKRYLPYMPPPKLVQSLSYESEPMGRHRLRINAGIKHQMVAKQTRFDPQSDLIPFSPPAYQLLGFELGLDLLLPGQKYLKVSLEGDNVLNKAYKEYTNRFRYYAHDLGRDIKLGLRLSF